MKKNITNKEKIEAIKMIYKLKAEYHKDEIVRNVTGGFSTTSTFSKILSVADVIRYVNKINFKV